MARRGNAALALGLVITTTASAFDAARPAVRTAYDGPASDAKMAAAVEGVGELLEVRDLLGGSIGGGFGSGIIDVNVTPPSAPAPPTVTILDTIVAGSDADLAAFGNPLLLDGTLLDIAADFTSARDVDIAAGGAIIDTHGFTLELDGVVTAGGLLIKQGSGALRLNGANVWTVAPFLREGTLSGSTASLQTDLHTYVAPAFTSPVSVTVEFDQDFDGSYAQAINPGPVLLSERQPQVNLIKSGTGTVALDAFGRRGAGTTHVRGGRLRLTGLATLASGALTVDAGAVLDLTGSERTALQVGPLAGGGDVVLGELEFTTSNRGVSTFDGSVTGSRYFGFLGDADTPSAARLTLTAAQAVSGITQIRHGTLALSGAGALHPEAIVDVATGNAVFDLSAASGDREVGRIAGSGTVELGTNALVIGRQDQSGTFAGTLAGSGDLVKLGSGTLSLTGTTAHTGTTRIVGGRLHALPQALGPVIVNDAELELVQDISTSQRISAYSGAISGSGRVIKSGDGLLWLRGANSYSGGTIIEDGVLIGSTVSLPGDIAIGDALAFYQVDDGRYSGALSGAGALLVFGPGQVTLEGTNTHVGGTYFSGKVRAAAAANLGRATSPLAFVGGTLALAGDVASTHAVFIAAQGGILDTAEHEFMLRGTLAGSGHWRKIGAGRLQLGGRHPDFTGALEIAAGRAVLDGALGGDLVVGPGATLEVAVNARSSTHLALTGRESRASLGGGHVAVTAVAEHLPERVRHSILTARGGVSGRFASVGSAVPGYDVTLGYTGTDVLLALTRSDESFALYADSPSQIRVGTALDGLRGAGGSAARAAVNALNLLTAEELPLALESIGGVSRDSVERALGLNVRAVNQLVTQRLNVVGSTATARGGGSANPLFAGAALGLGLVVPQTPSTHGAWLRGFGGTGSVETSTFSTDQDVLLGGIAAGYDQAFGAHLTTGLLAVVSEAALEQPNPRARTAIDSWQIGGYARWRGERVYFDGIVSYSDHDYKQRRQLELGLETPTARSDFDGKTWSTRLEAGYGYALSPALRVEPFVAFNHATHDTDAYRESGAGALDLVVAAHSDTSLRSELGTRLGLALDVAGVRDAGVYVYAAWAYEFTSANAVTARLAGDAVGVALPLRAVEPADHSARFGAGFHFLGSERLRIVFGLDGEADAHQMLLNASAGLRYTW